MKEIPKAYEPQKYEDKIYAEWERSGFFNPDKLPGKRKGVFSIVMPPPNVTGTLHVGHAVMLAIEDILTRFNRMKGLSALWLPGTDHAAIATQTKVEKILKENGQTRQSLGREKFLKEVEKFAAASKDTIRRQIRKMGSSCDWSREAYTLDKERSAAVAAMFEKMRSDGLIEKKYRPINWCTGCQSTLADDEIEYKAEKGRLYYIKYELLDLKSGKKAGEITVATTRPETKLGDTAVAVNPKDKRYKKFIGKDFFVRLGKNNIKVKIVSDRGIDMKFGTGAVGVTPAHSMIDYAIAEKNTLRMVQIIREDGSVYVSPLQELGIENEFDVTPLIINKETINFYRGNYDAPSISETVKLFLDDLEIQHKYNPQKTEEIEHNVGYCYRCGGRVEILPKEQWFIAVNKKITLPGNKYFKNKSLKEVALQVVKKGEIKIIPKRFEKIYFHWMDDLRDWCISRQIWFGHQIPGETDTFDTWFSSGMWTFSTLGWPKKTADLKKYHPTSVLETGYDILFFWVARMILMTTYAMGEVPFKNVYLHGLVRDEQGRKMSKSLGNVIDPLTVSAKYGTDAVRLSLVMGTSPGNDVKLSEEKIAGFRNFSNKLWNIARYIVAGNPKSQIPNPKPETLADKWILSKFNTLIAEVTKHLEKYEFSQAAEKLREFTWNDFADWYLEVSKFEIRNSKLLSEVLEKLLIMWHPFIPFVTEAIWGEILGNKNLIIEKWPSPPARGGDRGDGSDFEKIRELITKIRNLRAENKIEPGKIVNIYIKGKYRKLFEDSKFIIEGFTKSRAQFQNSDSIVSEIRILVDKLDMKKSKMRLQKELAEKEKYAEILRRKLENRDFVAHAPKAVVDGEREKLTKAEDGIKNLKRESNNINSIIKGGKIMKKYAAKREIRGILKKSEIKQMNKEIDNLTK